MLYKRNSKGKLQCWDIQIEENKFRTIEGMVDGKLTTSEWTTCIAKNIGTVKETTANYQAILESSSKRRKKREQGRR
jgi:hypothetical protein